MRLRIPTKPLERFALRPASGMGLAMSLGLVLGALPTLARHGELPNRIPEAAPYDTQEATQYPPPFDQLLAGPGSPGVCAVCHPRIFEEWNGSMMANAWRDPIWRAAFLLSSRLVATDGHCDIPDPPDGTAKSRLNPFANDDCTSTFDLGRARHTTSGSGSLLDGFCSRCHMPANYIDAVKPANISRDQGTALEHALIDPEFDPVAARGTPYAYATSARDAVNTVPGKLGISCTFCHTIAHTRDTPFHNFAKAATELPGTHDTDTLATARERLEPPDVGSPHLGYGIGGGAYRVSPQAIAGFERFGPLTGSDRTALADPYLSGVFPQPIRYRQGQFDGAPHRGYYSVLFERAEMCGTCHDVTNPLTIKNGLGRWVGGFPIERTYSEWANSRYADRPGNAHFDPAVKRDCQTCHMQQDYGQPATAQTLYDDAGRALAPHSGKLATTGPERALTYSHHFVGGNTYLTRLVGATADAQGEPYPYPELSVYSFSSTDKHSPFYNAYWKNVPESGPPTQHARLAWDRLRHSVDLDIEAPPRSGSAAKVGLRIRVRNTGCGHNFPTGFPEGRNAWVAVQAFDLAQGKELEIDDAFWQRRSVGIGYLAAKDTVDPNFPGCNWPVPAGAPDPYAWQFRAVASLGNGCPTLELPYAAPLNLVVNGDGLPTDRNGVVIDRDNPLGVPVLRDHDGDGDLYDDAFLLDTRLRPLPHPGATLELDRYSVLIPKGTVGPVAVTASVYYQSVEALVAKKLLGNLADTDGDRVLEPCVQGGPCDGRSPRTEPAVVEGAPPVPIRVRSVVIHINGKTGKTDTRPPRAAVYPPPNHRHAYRDPVVKVTASAPLRSLDAASFTLTDAQGRPVPAQVAQIASFTWALFPDQVFLERGQTYKARVERLCDLDGNCTRRPLQWQFIVASSRARERGDTRPPPRPAKVAAAPRHQDRRRK